MKKSQIFYTDKYKEVEQAIVKPINSQPDLISMRTATSTRAVSDAIQTILSEQFQPLLGDLFNDYSAAFARRAMADLAFTDKDGFYYVVDVKTHRLDTNFNMPNLTSVERLARFYEDDSNYFAILIVKYKIEGTRVIAKQVHFIPIEFLGWNCLTIGALRWGQIQIANANVISIDEGYSRKTWMLELCNAMIRFYPKEIGKIQERLDYLKRVKDYWENKAEV
jgi:hypothetical protein